MNHLH